MQLDDVVSSVADDDVRFAEAMDRSVRWLDRCIQVRREGGLQSVLGRLMDTHKGSAVCITCHS